MDEARFVIGGIAVTPTARQLAFGLHEAMIEPRVMQVLVALHRRCGEVVGRDALVDACWEGRIVGEDAINRTILKLRRALDETGGGVTVETIAKVGYRLRVDDSVPVVEESAAPAPSRGHWSVRARRWRNLLPLGLAAVVGASLPLASLLKHGVEVPTARAGVRHALIDADITIVTVQPLASKPGDLEAEEVRDGLQSAVVRHLTGSGTPVQIADTMQPAQGNGLIVRGSAISNRGMLRANIQLVTNSSAQVIWAEEFVRPKLQLDQFKEQIGIQIARELHCAYADGRQPYFNRDPELARMSLSHCDALGRDMEEALHYDWQVTRHAPMFARGWSEYAMDTALVAEDMPPRLKTEGFGDARLLARHALAIDPRQGLAYAALVVASQERPWPERLSLVRAGLKADPTNPELHLRDSLLLTTLGRQQDALGETIAAYRYDHLLPGKLIHLVLIELALGHPDTARVDFNLCQTYWPDLPDLDKIVIAFGIAGVQPDRALRIVRARAKNGGDQADAALAAFLAWRIKPTPASNLLAARTIIGAAKLDQGRGNELRLLALLGRFDDAFRVGDGLTNVMVDPGWFTTDLTMFRRDPRFEALMRRTGIPVVWQQTGLWPDFCAELGGIRGCQNALRLVR